MPLSYADELYALPPENYYLPAIQFSDNELGALQTAVNERASAGDSYMLAGYGEVSVAVGKHRLRFAGAIKGRTRY